jgi:hypothetical protein
MSKLDSKSLKVVESTIKKSADVSIHTIHAFDPSALTQILKDVKHDADSLIRKKNDVMILVIQK